MLVTSFCKNAGGEKVCVFKKEDVGECYIINEYEYICYIYT